MDDPNDFGFGRVLPLDYFCAIDAVRPVHLYFDLMKFLKKLYAGFMKVGMFIGEIISSVVMLVFYFTVFALFAIPYRLFGKSVKQKNSNWITREPKAFTLTDVSGE